MTIAENLAGRAAGEVTYDVDVRPVLRSWDNRRRLHVFTDGSTGHFVVRDGLPSRYVACRGACAFVRSAERHPEAFR